MKQVLIRHGQAVTEEVPAPVVDDDTILVQVNYSCISVGTELSGMKNSGEPIWKKALKNPDKVLKAVEMAATKGIMKTKDAISGKLAAGVPTGYSASGVVLAVGKNITDIQKGDKVACAGAQCAHHAEIINVPRNLAVLLPDDLDYESASTVTLGSIAMQGVRRANPTLGEKFVVIGLGIIGQLTVQILKANGCQVLGIDLDKKRIDLAKKLGLDYGIYPEENVDVQQIFRMTDGYGADGVIITAATKSSKVVSDAFCMCRKKGRVVLVGDVGLDLVRADFYQKELDFFISSSYGPGRYDEQYEEKGIDYPIGYVRWTENRNMQEYIRLTAEEKIKVKPMIEKIYPVDKAQEAYNALQGENKPLMVLLAYPDAQAENKLLSKIMNPNIKYIADDKIHVAVVGAGGFAKGMHLPNLKDLNSDYHLSAIMSRTGHNAMETARQFEADYATTDYNDILSDDKVDAVIITTRHNLHGQMALEALKAGKHVLVEKPLAMKQDELDKIKEFYQQGTERKPVLLTGFNRRFSVYAQKIKKIISNRSNPLIINYRMNAGYIPLNHWVHTEEGGGRNIGEACHIYDLFTFFTDSKVSNIQAASIEPKTAYYGKNDNFTATISFTDGSVATLTYTALGHKAYPKEQMEIFADGKVLVLNDYKQLDIYGSKEKGIQTKISDKGQKEELQRWAECMKQGNEWPIPLWQLLQSTEISYKVEKIIKSL